MDQDDLMRVKTQYGTVDFKCDQAVVLLFGYSFPQQGGLDAALDFLELLWQSTGLLLNID